MIPRIDTYAYDLISKGEVAKQLLNVSVKYTTKCLGYCGFVCFSEGKITITSLGYRITILKIIFLEWEDFITSKVLDKTLTLNESLSVVKKFSAFSSGFDRMIIVTDEGDFLFYCDKQTEKR